MSSVIRVLFLMICCFGFSMGAQERIFYYPNPHLEANSKNYPIKEHHEKLGLDCATCHGDGVKENKFEVVESKKCLECHSSFESLKKRTAKLGYDDNVHGSPHYPKMDCNLCHMSHKPSKNYCVMCHSQDSMKSLVVP